jgi:hypothetical protein
MSLKLDLISNTESYLCPTVFLLCLPLHLLVVVCHLNFLAPCLIDKLHTESWGIRSGRTTILSPCPLYYVSEHGIELYLSTVYLGQSLACHGLLVCVPTLPFMPMPVPSWLYVVCVSPVVKAWLARLQFDCEICSSQ